MQDFSRTSRQKTCPDGPAESEDCHYASAALQHNGNPLPVVVRFACLRNSGTCPLAKTSLSRRQPSIATLRREIDVIVRSAPNGIKLSLHHAAHCSGRLSPSSASAAVASPPARPPHAASPLAVQGMTMQIKIVSVSFCFHCPAPTRYLFPYSL